MFIGPWEGEHGGAAYRAKHRPQVESHRNGNTRGAMDVPPQTHAQVCLEGAWAGTAFTIWPGLPYHTRPGILPYWGPGIPTGTAPLGQVTTGQRPTPIALPWPNTQHNHNGGGTGDLTQNTPPGTHDPLARPTLAYIYTEGTHRHGADNSRLGCCKLEYITDNTPKLCIGLD